MAAVRASGPERKPQGEQILIAMPELRVVQVTPEQTGSWFWPLKQPSDTIMRLKGEKS